LFPVEEAQHGPAALGAQVKRQKLFHMIHWHGIQAACSHIFFMNRKPWV
jgi:hypothetical protein